MSHGDRYRHCHYLLRNHHSMDVLWSAGFTVQTPGAEMDDESLLATVKAAIPIDSASSQSIQCSLHSNRKAFVSFANKQMVCWRYSLTLTLNFNVKTVDCLLTAIIAIYI